MSSSVNEDRLDEIDAWLRTVIAARLEAEGQSVSARSAIGNRLSKEPVIRTSIHRRVPTGQSSLSVLNVGVFPDKDFAPLHEPIVGPQIVGFRPGD
jgi:hypothetical protein